MVAQMLYEAGFTDANKDGIVDGTLDEDGKIVVDADGKVIGSDGYTGTRAAVTDTRLILLPV